MADLTFADLTGVNLLSVYLDGANIAFANLTHSNLRNVHMVGAVLDTTNLTGANLTSADLRNASLAGVGLHGAMLLSTNLSGANLNGADISGADLSGANLASAQLARSNMDGARLSDTDMAGAQLSHSDLARAIFEPKSLPEPRGMASAKNLELLTYDDRPTAIVQVRKQFQDAGFREHERKITYALMRRQTQLSWEACWSRKTGDKARAILWSSDSNLANCSSFILNRVFFDWTC